MEKVLGGAFSGHCATSRMSVDSSTGGHRQLGAQHRDHVQGGRLALVHPGPGGDPAKPGDHDRDDEDLLRGLVLEKVPSEGS